MGKTRYFLLGFAALLTACQADDTVSLPEGRADGMAFSLMYEDFENGATRSGLVRGADYDRVEFCVVGTDGGAVSGIKGLYDRESSEIRIEGLREGEYRLLVIGIRGDADADGVSIKDIGSIDDEWLAFPSEMSKPLEAEYFYSQTPFSVISQPGESGNVLVAVTEGEAVQRRIVGRADFSFEFNNPYVETAMQTNSVTLTSPIFHTTLSGNGDFGGRSSGSPFVMDLTDARSYILPPTADGGPLNGEIEMTTRNYRGHTERRAYSFTLDGVFPNRIGSINTVATHPDDNSSTAFVTERAFDMFGLSFILQDGEPKDVYTDAAQRSFNTSEPLQVSVTDDGRLHVRFYSPREVSDVLIRARVASIGDEFFDLAYFDRIPAFADFYGELPMTLRKTFRRTESGRIIETDAVPAEAFASAEYRISSDDPFWKKIEAIEHGWNIGFSLYGGDPDLPDGGPVGNWMGIRPVHCREAVALFLNFTYMIDMPEHEEILRANVDRLYGNGGVNDKVTVETVLRQMRQQRTLRVGLVYPGNGIIGLGGGSAFGAYQQAWFQHYFNAYSCEIMFHELGHVMGYNHSSSFTYGPWAQELMNNFYVDHIGEMPIDSPSYLNSSQNPNKY